MRDIILSQPHQITHSLEVNKTVTVAGDFDGLIVAGLGGSAQPGDLLQALALTRLPLLVHRSYDLPATSFKNPLVVLSSHSGNTEETISAYYAARQKGYAMLINTSGGQLAELARQENIPRTTIDFAPLQPRHTLLASFTSLLTALINSGLASDIRTDLTTVAQKLTPLIPTQESAAKALAKKLEQTTPSYYASDKLAFAAFNFKIQTNENAKTTAFWNFFPELNHNEMLGFSQGRKDHNARFHVVMLRDNDDHPRIKARMDVTAELYKKWGVDVSHIEVKGSTQLEKIFSTVCFGLWTTYFLAEALGQDPVPVAGVEDFKKRLAEIK